jgi:hypothetical protein
MVAAPSIFPVHPSALEEEPRIVVASGLIDKLTVHRELGVREVRVFRNGEFRLVTLRDGSYEPIEKSEIFPEVNLDRLAHFAMEPDQHVAVREFRDELRSRAAVPGA